MRPTHESNETGRLVSDPEGNGIPHLFGLAPGGVYHASGVTTEPVSSYLTFSPLLRPAPAGRSGLFSVALSVIPSRLSVTVCLRSAERPAL